MPDREKMKTKLAFGAAVLVTILNAAFLLYILLGAVEIGFDVFDPRADIYVWPAALFTGAVELVSIAITETTFFHAKKFVSRRLTIVGRSLPVIGLVISVLYYCLDLVRIGVHPW